MKSIQLCLSSLYSEGSSLLKVTSPDHLPLLCGSFPSPSFTCLSLTRDAVHIKFHRAKPQKHPQSDLVKPVTYIGQSKSQILIPDPVVLEVGLLIQPLCCQTLHSRLFTSPLPSHRQQLTPPSGKGKIPTGKRSGLLTYL